MKNFDVMAKNRPHIFFFSMKEGISIRNYLRNPIKMVRMLYKYDFWCELVVFVVKKVEKSHIRENVDFFVVMMVLLVMVMMAVVMVVALVVIVVVIVLVVVVVKVVVVVVD